MKLNDVETMLEHYIVAALWSSTDEDGDSEFLDGTYNVDDLSRAVRRSMRADCRKFYLDNREDLAEMNPEQVGHDFWLTRNGHGAGFFDRGLGDLGDRLTEASHKFRECHLLAEKGKVYLL